MSIQSLPFEQLGMVVLTDVGPQTPPESFGTAALYLVDGKYYFRDQAGTEHPVVVGADGAGVVSIDDGDSPYALPETARLVLPDTTAGAITVRLPAAGGLGRYVIFADSARSFQTNALTIDGNGNNIGGSATLVLNVTGSAVVLYWTGLEWSIVASADLAAAVAPHASTHLAGGSDPLLAAPGTIGGNTPGTVNATTVYVTSSSPVPVANRAQVIRATNAAGVSVVGEGGAMVSIEADAVSATTFVRRRAFTVQIAAAGTYDIVIGGAGGRIDVAAVGATGSSYATASFANNGTTTFNGATYTGYTTTLGTPASINIGAAVGLVRIENTTADAVNLVVTLDQLIQL